MKIWKRVKGEWSFIVNNNRGGKGGGGAPEQRPPSPEELAQIESVTQLYQQQLGYGEAMMPWRIPGEQYQMGLQMGVWPGAGAPGAPTGAGVAPTPPAPTPAAPGPTPAGATTPYGRMGGMKGGGVAPQPGDIPEWFPQRAGGGMAPQPGAPGAAVPGAPPAGVPPVGIPGAPTAPGAAGAPAWFQQIAGEGGLMGLGAQQQAQQLRTGTQLAGGGFAPGAYGALGTPYGMGQELQSALGGTAQWLQQRGLLKSGLMPELGTRRAAEIAERSEQKRRGELAGLLQIGMTPRGGA